VRTFPIRLQRRFRIPLLLWGVLRRNSYVTLDENALSIRFGLFRLRVNLADVERWEIGGPYRWWMALGVRGTPGVPEISFAGSAHGAVVLLMRQPIPRWTWKRNLRRIYVAADDLEGLAGELERRGIPRSDARTA
jgi:hypothetical protein